MKLKSKLFTSAVAFTMVLSMAAPMVASAQTTAELTAQINSLLAMIAQLQAQIAGGASTGAATTFTKDLTVGSTGAEVTALQQFLVSKGFLTMPAGVAMGYFGSVTKTALSAYQTSAGISPAAGYFGPITRAKVNAAGGTTTGGTTTGGTTTGGITTPGVEGTLAVTESSAGIVSTIYEGDDMAPILGIKVEAKNSDMAVQRIKLDMDESTGSDTKFYNRIFSKLYVTEGGNVLASVDLNSSTVIKDGTDYFVTIAGFNLIVPKGTSKTIVIKGDVMPSIDTTDLALTYTISLPAAGSGVRAVDGAGIDQYAGTNSVSNDLNPTGELSDSATLKVSLNNSSPKKSDVVCTLGTDEDECDKLTVLVMDVRAEKDQVTITDLNVEIDETTAGGASAATLYLYDGSTELDNTSVVTSGDNYGTFSDLDYVVPKDTTKTLTVKVDLRDATSARAGFTAAASSTDFTTENTLGDSVTESGSATGYEIGIRNVGPEVTLVSKSITTAGVPQSSAADTLSTSTLTATFTVKVKAVGGDLEFGTVASSTPMFGAGASYFKLYKGGISGGAVGVGANTATSTSFSTPSGVTVSANTFTLAEGSEVTIPVTFQTYGRADSAAVRLSGLYSVGLEGIQTNSVYASTFMAGEADWRTADVSFP